MEATIPKNLKTLRTAAGYTQGEFARAIGISQLTYSKYESGLQEMPYDLLEAASDYLGCDMDILYADHIDADTLMMATAFRMPDIADEEDIAEVMRFKRMVKAYLKIERLEEKVYTRT